MIPFTVSVAASPETWLFFSASMRGCNMDTALFMVRAVLTTWGRNIFPSPKSLPTRFMPSIRVCSTISMAGVECRASRSSSRYSSTPCARAWCRRSPASRSRQASRVTAPASCCLGPLMVPAISMSRDVAPASVSRMTSSTARRNGSGISEYMGCAPGLTMAKSSPAAMA